MDFTGSPNADSSQSSGESPEEPSKEEHVTSVSEDFDVTCWGCGLHLTVSPYEPAFICGWCGAITNRNASKIERNYLWWRHVRDRCFVGILSVFMLLMICGVICAIYPVAFSISYICGATHVSISIVLAITTISTYCLAAFRSPGAPPLILWGSYSVVGRGGLENYTYCLYCKKPKSPRTHHCRSCQMCVLDMDHHCPFIGNCVGAANHRNFIFFLISALTGTIYVSIISGYAATQIWPPIRPMPPAFLNDLASIDRVIALLKEIIFAFSSSIMLLSVEGAVLLYLLIASIFVGIGLAVLLFQQLYYIYEGKTYLNHLISQGVEEGISSRVGEKDVRNLFRFFDCPSSASKFLPCFWSLRKSHKK
ncbi:protein S-acyltransferase 11-like isoform X1 [Apium graveolens]|uniref:protein S-acyltransferase 11-like isoform X1 n=1 Tax=Apium graveolens TaxID=4045 RepID=UPI003D7AC16E